MHELVFLFWKFVSGEKEIKQLRKRETENVFAGKIHIYSDISTHAYIRMKIAWWKGNVKITIHTNAPCDRKHFFYFVEITQDFLDGERNEKRICTFDEKKNRI